MADKELKEISTDAATIAKAVTEAFMAAQRESIENPAETPAQKNSRETRAAFTKANLMAQEDRRRLQVNNRANCQHLQKNRDSAVVMHWMDNTRDAMALCLKCQESAVAKDDPAKYNNLMKNGYIGQNA